MNVVCGEQIGWTETAKRGGKVVVCTRNVYMDLTAYEGHEPEAQGRRPWMEQPAVFGAVLSGLMVLRLVSQCVRRGYGQHKFLSYPRHILNNFEFV